MHSNGYPWTLGSDNIDNGIDGAINMNGKSGVAVAMNSSGTAIAVGAPGVDEPLNDVSGTTQDIGHVRVWSRASESATSWTQKGNTILGNSAGDESGTSLALSENGLTVAVGAPKYDAGGAPVALHRYFGLAPTETSSAYEQWYLKGWEIQDSNGVNILSASTILQHIDGDSVFEMPYNAPYDIYSQMVGWVNYSTWAGQGNPARGTAAYDSYAANHGGVEHFWEHGYNHSPSAYPTSSNFSPPVSSGRPVLVAYSSAPIVDGAVLTSRHHHHHTAAWSPATWAIKGHIVSSATGAPGSWEIRGTFDMSASYPASGSQQSGYPNYEYVHTQLAPQQGAVAGDHGTVKVYDYNVTLNAWLARYMTPAIFDFVGGAAEDNMGARRSVALSDDGLIIAIGSPGFEASTGNIFPEQGQVTVWAYSSSTQQYTPRYLSDTAASGTPYQQISVVSLSSDGTFLGIGGWGLGTYTADHNSAGIAKTYRWSTANSPNGIYQLSSQTTSNYAGSDIGDKYGWTVALSGDGMTFAVGAPLRDDPSEPAVGPGQPSTDDGVVRVWKGVDEDQHPLAGRQVGSEIITNYQAPEFDVWTLLDLALTEIAALKIKVQAIENDNSN